MTYQEQLQTPEWKAKRLVILERDNYRCMTCNCERTKFLGLSQKFGIKTVDQLEEAGYSGFRILDENKGVMLFNKNFLNVANFVGSNDSEPTLDKLKFALQWKEGNPIDKRALGGWNLICFTNNISEKDKFPDLNIHHKHYIIDKKAWEYGNDALITLCCKCHQDEHDNNEIFVYTLSGDILYKAENCSRCDGSGYLLEFNYYHHGICFSCHGHGVLLK